MSRTYVRSFRLEEELGVEMDQLPKGTANTLVNELIAYYFANPELQALIPIKDERFPSDEPVTLSDAKAAPPKAAKKRTKKPEITVVSQTGVTETTEELVPTNTIEEGEVLPTADISEVAPQYDENFEYIGGQPDAPMPPDFLKKEPEKVDKPVDSVDKPSPKSFLPGF